MRKALATFLLIKTILFSSPCFSQRTITMEEAELLFINYNYDIKASNTRVELAEANLKQAKLRSNPQLTIEQINLWSTQSQREGKNELIPPLFGSVAKNRQFAIELEQEITLGGKRRNRVRKERSNQVISQLNAQLDQKELLLQFKTILFEELFYKESLFIIKRELATLKKIISSYQKQLDLGLISPSELLRLQTHYHQTQQELIDTQETVDLLKSNIHSLLGVSIEEGLNFNLDAEKEKCFRQPQLENYIIENNNRWLAIKESKNQLKHNLAYERAQRIPNLTLLANYDRFGGVWKDFIGVGIQIELPLSNRNQGDIKAAQALLNLSLSELEQQKSEIANRIETAKVNHLRLLEFNSVLTNNPIHNELDQLLSNYTKNLLNKNISLLEFLDFIDSYKEGKTLMLKSKKNICISYYNLEYLIGQKLN